MEKQSHIIIDGRQIAYFKKNAGKSKCIVFIHGHSSSRYVWRKQLSDDRFQEYYLIAIDLPGNGDSGPGLNPEKDYGAMGSAELLVEAVKLLVKDLPYILVGFSFGNNIIAEMIALGLRPKGLALLSPCIVGKGFELDKILVSQQTDGNVYLIAGDPNDQEINNFLSKELTSQDPEDQKSYLRDFKRVAPGYRKLLFQSINNQEYSDEVETLKQANIITLIAFGLKDKIFKIDYLDNAELPLWKKDICKLKDADHFLPTDNFQKVNETLQEFANDVL